MKAKWTDHRRLLNLKELSHTAGLSLHDHRFALIPTLGGVLGVLLNFTSRSYACRMTIHDPNVSVQRETASPLNTLSRALGFGNGDQERWWNDTAPLLHGLLVATGYDVHSQYQHLLFHHRHVLPALGPYPEAQPDSIVPGGCPYELSVNFQQGKAVVRFDFAPAGDSKQNQFSPGVAINRLLADLSDSGHEIDTRLYYHFTNALALTKRDIAFLQKNPTPHSSTQNILSWDLKGATNDLKMYFFPLVKADAVQVPSGQLVLDAIRKADDGCYDSPALGLVEFFLRDRKLLSNVCVLGWDCVPDNGRVKIYLADPDVSIAKIRDLWTLGGQLSNATVTKGLELLLELWDCLGLQEGVRSTTELGQPEQEDGRSGLTFSYELRPGDRYPEPKIYFPLVGENDSIVSQGLARFVARLGWTELDSYPSALADVL